PMRILILGDFSGQASREAERPEIAKRRPIVVDRDNVDQVMSKLGVGLRLSVAGNETVGLKFQELEDFHPDRIFLGSEFFRIAKQERSQLSDPATFSSLAAKMRGWERKMLDEGLAPAKQGPSGQPVTDPEQLLKQILEGAPPKGPSSDPLAP